MPRSSLLGLTALPLAAVLALSACAVSPGSPDRTPDPGTSSGPGLSSGPASSASWDESYAKGAIAALPAVHLTPFDDCSQLLTYYQANALELVTPYGLGPGGYGYGVAVEDSAAAGSAPNAATDGASQAMPQPGTDFSTTNVQEEGVDEADIVKTDGTVIIAVTNGKVRIVDVATEQVVATVALPGDRERTSPQEILLHGSTLVVLSQEWGGYVPADGYVPVFDTARTLVTTVDISDPAAPRTVGSVRMEGSYRSARLVDGTLRMVMVTQPPGVLLTNPRKGTLAAEDEALERNRQLVRETTIDDWVPHRQELDADGRVVSTEPLLGCDEISRPRDPAGLSTMTVLTFDVGGANPAPTSGAGLVATGSTVYASQDRLLVGTSGWDLWGWLPEPAADRIGSWPGGTPVNRTDLHAFDISDPDATRYVASGTVEGRLVNQWALDEEDGIIRVATTTDPPGASVPSSSSLVVLDESGEELTEVGRVDGMGLTEQIQSVRYLSKDLAAIVTFRQTDPLYLVDTSDPTAPEVKGELKIPGFSSYLHPVGDGWLLGVGQDADVDTGATQGLQVSLFDIRDLSAPRQAEVLTWKDAWSPVEHDHRAFLSWPQRDLVVLPYTQWSEPAEGKAESNTAGVAMLTVGPDTLTEGPTLSTLPQHVTWGEAPMRTMVVGDQLWTLDWQGLARFDLDTHEGGWAVDLP